MRRIAAKEEFMSASRAQRGRPKGSGLNDQALLKAIADLMAVDTSLKPTTAIKAIGITEPSAVRRLREKLKESRDGTSPILPVSENTRPRVMAMAVPSRTKKSAQLRIVKNEPAPQTAPAATPALNADFEAWFSFWCGLGLRNVNTAIELQSAFAKQVFALPLTGLAMRQHIAANEFAMATCAPRKTGKD